MPQPLSLISIRLRRRPAADPHRHRLAGGLASTAFCEEVADACSSPSGSAMTQTPPSPSRRTSWLARCAAMQPARSGRSGCGSPAAALRCAACGGEAREQVVHLADRALERRDHVGAEFGIVGVALGIAGQQRQLADEVLHVVEDEGEAAVELLEAAGVR
jgi:hypothetical protein